MKTALMVLTVVPATWWGELKAEGEEEIFNGKDLTGWVVPDGNIWWTVAEGVLRAKSGPEQKGSILWTEKRFRDFDLQGEFRFDGKGDSGFFLRDDRQQIQIGVSGSLKRDMTGSPYIAGKGYPVEAEEKEGVKGVKNLLKINAWNTMRVLVVGPKYDCWLNGVQVMSYTSEDAREEGPIGLQLHGGREMSIEFRHLRVAKVEGE